MLGTVGSDGCEPTNGRPVTGLSPVPRFHVLNLRSAVAVAELQVRGSRRLGARDGSQPTPDLNGKGPGKDPAPSLYLFVGSALDGVPRRAVTFFFGGIHVDVHCCVVLDDRGVPSLFGCDHGVGSFPNPTGLSIAVPALAGSAGKQAENCELGYSHWDSWNWLRSFHPGPGKHLKNP